MGSTDLLGGSERLDPLEQRKHSGIM